MFLTVKKLVQAGELGEVVEYETRFDRCRLDAKRGLARERDFQPPGFFGISGRTSLTVRWCCLGQERLGHLRSASEKRRVNA